MRYARLTLILACSFTVGFAAKGWYDSNQGVASAAASLDAQLREANHHLANISDRLGKIDAKLSKLDDTDK
jgi:hypothetical protein